MAYRHLGKTFSNNPPKVLWWNPVQTTVYPEKKAR